LAAASDETNLHGEQARRVLVAEDSPVTQDLLKLVLEQRGHSVDLASDGREALAALEKQSYDVVLLDFHLPKMDGLEVASRYRGTRPGSSGPRFIAITSDIKGLLGHSADCENFDEVIPKPLDLEEVLKVVERECICDTPVAEIATGREDAEARLFALDGQKFDFLRWPEDFNSDRLSARGVRASLADGSFDAIMLNECASVRDLSVIWTTKTLHLLPIIDMTGSLPKLADLDGTKICIEETGELDRLIAAFKKRRANLHEDLVYSDDIGEKLIGRMFVSGGSLQPRYNPASRELICYNTVLDFRSIDKEIKEHLARGFVHREFFDRFHTCDRCGSSHFNIREECVECGSGHLEEEAYLHHFKCAYQGPESDFREDDDLVCPKCRMELSHFSVDYDKPGSMMQCQSCDHATSEPDIGFVCMECEAHYGGDTVHTRNIYAYELTQDGVDFARAGRALLDGKNSTLRFAELPLELIVSMNAELKKYQTDKTPFSLLNISYRNEREIEKNEGPRMYAQSRELLLQNLRNTVRKGDCVVNGQNYDFALLKGTQPKEVRAGLEELCAEATASLRVDLGLHIDVFGPEDFN
jgi:CheY-like chemotaxis protein